MVDTGARKKPNRVLDTLDQLLEGQQFINGDEFSVADVAIAAYLLYVPQFFPDVSWGKWRNISEYMLRCASRPAYAEAFGKQVTLSAKSVQNISC